MARGITVKRYQDTYGQDVLLVEKKRGKLNLDEVEDLLRYSERGMRQGCYVMIIRATESTCEGAGWMDEVEPKGDTWELYQVEQEEPCPVCRELIPAYQWCPECGASLIGEGLTKEQTAVNAEKILASMEAEAIRAIKGADCAEARAAWYHSHPGSIDFARQMGPTNERRQQIYDRFLARAGKSM